MRRAPRPGRPSATLAPPPRIIAGRHRGRALVVPAGGALRPTAARTREAVFNILAHGVDWPGIEGAAVADVCAGTGAFGFEALSRGAAHATFIDTAADALDAIALSARSLGEAARVTPLGLDAAALPPPPRAAAAPLGLVFVDPPYGSGLARSVLAGLARRGWLAPDAVCVVEIGHGETLAAPEAYAPLDARDYGAARILVLRFSG